MATTVSTYKSIFKSIFIFGFAQILYIIVRVIQNKVIALLLGPEGLGTMGLFNTSANMISTGAGLGISGSAVRDISEANAAKDSNRFSRVICLTRKIILFTALLGIITMIVLSPWLSKWTFNNKGYIGWYVLLSLAVSFQILFNGELSILMGMRQLKQLAKVSVIGSILGLAASIPLYFLFGNAGIVPSLIVTALASFIVSNRYVSKIEYEQQRIGLKQVFSEGATMIKMGVALMLVSFLPLVSNLVLSAYISYNGGLANVGFFQAGSMIITGYFSVILRSMVTDYYPRISAVYNDNEAIAVEFNKQSETGLVLVFPCALLFIFLSSTFVRFLYSSEFALVNDYLDFAFIGTLITIVSDGLSKILLAKQTANIFILSELLQRTVWIAISVLFYSLWELSGLGLAMVYFGLQQLVVMCIIMYCKYKILMSRRLILLLCCVIGMSLLTMIIRNMSESISKYGLGLIVILFSLVFSLSYTKIFLGLDFVSITKQRLKR